MVYERPINTMKVTKWNYGQTSFIYFIFLVMLSNKCLTLFPMSLINSIEMATEVASELNSFHENTLLHLIH